ncbi:hypothetical protein [Kitasatospora camelliae]|uniref:Uncharacterized protein n=1 Tax=Kitasatospora camelliae TaxID=3156397 RepID=A0AAU8JY68_9ACTN
MSTETVEPDAPEPADPPRPAVPPQPTAAPAPAAEPTTDPTAEAAAVEPAPAEDGTAEQPAEDTAAPAAKRSLSTRALLLAALLIGPVAGAAVGYAVQAARPATPLPPLKPVQLAYPAERIDAQALADAAPKPLNIDGDLRDLLLKRPDGTKEWADNAGSGGWMDAAEMAESVGRSDQEFQELLRSGFRRAAVTSWREGETEYRIRLIQYFPDDAGEAVSGARQDSTGGAGVSKVPGNAEGTVKVLDKPRHYADSTKEYYYGEALARKGTVIMDVEVYSPGAVDRAKLEDLAKRQWERLA